MTRVAVLACWMVAGACGPKATNVPSGSGRGQPGLHVTLYRDHAVVAHRVDVVVPAATTTKVHLKIAAGVAPDDIYLVERSELVVREIRSATATEAPKQPVADGCDEVSCAIDNNERPCCARYERGSEWDDSPKPVVEKPVAPTEIEVVVGGPREGKFSLLVGYDTDKITWGAAYTMTTPPTHDHVLLRGALVVRNATGLDLGDAHVQVIDSRHGSAKQRIPAQVGAELAGLDPNSTPVALPRDLGRFDLPQGDTRIELLPNAVSRPMRSVLVYDPIGPGIDYPHSAPVQDKNLGVVPAPSTHVTESFEIARGPDTAHLPEGPVQLLERRSDGSLVLIGESTLFGVGALSAAVDQVAVGTAEKVVGRRERRELTIDNDRKRVVEEFVLAIENKRARPVEVVLREHLYRGENWTIAYRSVLDITKEGKQQIAMRITVPPGQKQTVLYVVVYSWGT